MNESDPVVRLQQLREKVAGVEKRHDLFTGENGIEILVTWPLNGPTTVLITDPRGYALEVSMNQDTGEVKSHRYVGHNDHVIDPTRPQNDEEKSACVALTNEFNRLRTDPTKPFSLPLRLRPEVILDAENAIESNGDPYP